ncbi:MAG: C39 family peptidase [Ardenticatenaceae bacterium]|nr:C39 family peptidase [Ardenticatenaceae bacterium]
MKRFLLITLGLIILLITAGVLALPPLLRAIPSRYVSLMPEPIQALGVRDHVEILPTVEATVELAAFIQPSATPTIGVPASPTPVPTTVSTSESNSPPPTSPTPTPIPPTPVPIPFEPTARLYGIQHQFQAWNNCGPATIAMGLSYFQIYTRQSESADWLKPNPEDRNVTPAELVAFVEATTDLEGLDRVNGTIEQIKQLLSNDVPVIIETGIDPPGAYAWMEWYGHYLLVVGYDDELETFWVYDSWLADGVSAQQDQIAPAEGRPISYQELDRYWRHFNRHFVAIYEPAQGEKVSQIIGEAMDDQAMWSAALDVNLAELEDDPENPYLWFNLGSTYNGLGEYEMAAKAFDNARAFGLPWRMLWYQFGPYEAYYEIGRYQDVIDLADATLYQRPYFEESYYYRGLAYQALGNQREARKDLNRAAEFNPRFHQAEQALAALEE